MKTLLKEKSILMRKQGYSIKEISDLLKVSKSSASLWVRKVSISDIAKQRLISRIQQGRYRSAEIKKQKSKEKSQKYNFDAKLRIGQLDISKDAEMLLCVMLYWCEGIKDEKYGIVFTNSDPNLVKLFIDLLVKHFDAKREKFKCLLHLHDYHIPEKQKKFWAQVLNLKLTQFKKHWLKPNTGKRLRENYPGCMSLRYYDNSLSGQIIALAKAYLDKGA